jgi:predicted nucleotidyltransferase
MSTMRDTKVATEAASGRFVLRLPPALHASIRDAARQAGLSLNEYCVRVLASAPGAAVGPGGSVMARAAAAFGDELVGIVVHGSWARGEAMAASDVDVLLVLEPTSRVTRATYATWDLEPLTYEGRDVDVHFATLPDEEADPGPMWLEVAIDGIVMSDRDHRIARYLTAVRRRIAAGAWTRHLAHGHPYWAAN